MTVGEIIRPRFERWRPLMERILERSGNYATVDDIYKACSEVRMLFFSNQGAFAIIQVIEHPRTSYLHILLAGGGLKALFDLEETVTKFGRVVGATKFTFLGRAGFPRVLAGKGWTSPMTYMEKEITDGR